MSFNDDFTDWQYASGVIIPKQRGLMIKDITVYCAYDYNANDAYFTNISLVLEPAETYSYDSKGNPIAATDGSAKTVTMMRTTVSTQPQIIIVVCCITLRRSAYDCDPLRLCVYRRTVQ